MNFLFFRILRFLFNPASWATGLCKDLVKQNKWERRYGTTSMAVRGVESLSKQWYYFSKRLHRKQPNRQSVTQVRGVVVGSIASITACSLHDRIFRMGKLRKYGPHPIDIHEEELGHYISRILYQDLCSSPLANLHLSVAALFTNLALISPTSAAAMFVYRVTKSIGLCCPAL
ncbi:hypothetical protein J6590_079530 [Homalodisca vitripennis]|nr:hypothetical protein J6590_079530 [Homalodisca vitripennis]